MLHLVANVVAHLVAAKKGGQARDLVLLEDLQLEREDSGGDGREDEARELDGFRPCDVGHREEDGPEDHTDFIFSNLAERVGFVGSIVLVALFFFLIWRILHVATISRDRFGVLIAVGVATIFLFHVFVNIGMTMGIMPVTGIPLPFISYGRSNLVVSVLSLGLLQSIAIHSKAEVSKHPKV